MKISETTFAIIKGTAVVSIVGFIVVAFFVESLLALVAGVVIGFLASIAKIMLLEKAVDKVIGMQEATNAKLTMQAGYFFRYLLTGAALALSGFLLSTSGFIGAVIGLLSMNFSVYFMHFFVKNKVENKKEKGGEK